MAFATATVAAAPPAGWVAVTAGVPDDAMPARLSRDETALLVWSQHYAPLAGWCASLVGDADAGRDIASEAFTRLLSRWMTVADPKGYLYVTAHNLVRDRWRREKRDRVLQERLERTTETEAPAADGSIRDLVERLPERMRGPVLLFYFADFSIAEIARLLHRPEGTVKRLLHDGRDRLKAMVVSEA